MVDDLIGAVIGFFKMVGFLLYRIWYSVEAILIVIPVEFVMRLRYRLDPRTYSETLRIKKVSEGKERTDGSFFVLVLFAPSSLPAFTYNIIDAVERSGHNLIIVSNLGIAAELREELSGKCHCIIERANVGRDFGAYKDGISYVLSRYPDAKRIVIMNDSLFFLSNTLDSLVRELNSPHEFIGVTEVHQIHYHVQSFMLSFGPNVLGSAAFRKFWKRYRPISTRRWAIHKGEVKLTRELTKAGFRPHVIFQAANLLPQLHGKSSREITEAIRLLPEETRSDAFNDFVDVLGRSVSPAAVRAVSFGIKRIQPGAIRNTADELSIINSQAAVMDQWSLGVFADIIVTSVRRHNQMHHGAFLFMKYLGMPIFKRDIFYRELYSLEDVHRFLSETAEPLRDEILGDLRRSGSGAHIRGFKRLLFRHGSI